MYRSSYLITLTFGKPFCSNDSAPAAFEALDHSKGI